MEPIQIELDDDRLYTQVAYLIDGTEVITEIIETRNAFDISQFFQAGDYDAWNNHVLILAGFNPVEYWKMDKISPEIEGDNRSSWEKKAVWLKEVEPKMLKRLEIMRKFDEKIANIRRLYRFPALFDQIIVQAILFNKISHFRTAYPRISYEPEYNPVKYPDNETDAVLSIVVSPFSKIEDILQAFKDCQSGKLRVAYDRYAPTEPKINSDTRNKIREYRQWFWMNYKTNPNRMGYKKIAKLTGVNVETVRSGIKSYAEFINIAS